MTTHSSGAESLKENDMLGFYGIASAPVQSKLPLLLPVMYQGQFLKLFLNEQGISHHN